MERSHLQWYYKRTMDTLRYEGIHILLWRTFKICLSPLGALGMVTLCRKDLTLPLREMRAKVEVTFGQATESDIEELTTLVVRRYGPKAYKKRDMFRDKLLERFAHGNKCFVAKIGTEIVHYNWIFFQGWEHIVPGQFTHLKDDEAICEDGSTVEAWRGKSIHTAVNTQMLLFLKQSGYRRAYTTVNTDYKSSKKALYRVGWEISGTMLSFIPRGAKKGWIWRISGTLVPFVEKQIPEHQT